MGYPALKQDLVDGTVQIAEIFTGIFLIMSLFSIASGILLIILIFTMLAAECRTEMGVERAVGTQHRQLIQQFVSGGTGYAIFAGFVGAALGLVLARNLFNDEDFAASAGGFVIPWTILAVIVIATIASALLTAWVPSRRAARIAPAEALRYE